MQHNAHTGQWLTLLQQSLAPIAHEAFIYTIQPGDTLSNIIIEHYKLYPPSIEYRVAEAALLEYNHHITNPNIIYSGKPIRLMPLPEMQAAVKCLAPTHYHAHRHLSEPLWYDRTAHIRNAMPTDLAEQEAFKLLAWFEENHGILNASLGGGVNAFGNLVGQGNDALMKQIDGLYNEYKAGKITKGQYQYRRQKVVKELSRRMGGLLNKKQLHIVRRKGVSPTLNIERYANKLSRLSRHATRGGVVLAGAGVYLSCRDIANTDNHQEKNEIFVETAVSTFVGGVASVALGLVLVTNPVGWGIALALGAGAAAASFAAGKGAREYYSVKEDKIDFVSGLGVDKVCK